MHYIHSKIPYSILGTHIFPLHQFHRFHTGTGKGFDLLLRAFAIIHCKSIIRQFPNLILFRCPKKCQTWFQTEGIPLFLFQSSVLRPSPVSIRNNADMPGNPKHNNFPSFRLFLNIINGFHKDYPRQNIASRLFYIKTIF